METKDVFLTDKPIDKEEDDRFQRYSFSKRIAETIATRKNSESIIIGLFGAWGEGKTSVLNFIKKELKLKYPEVTYLTFNPWRFADESTILYSFFNTLAEALKKCASSEISNENKPPKKGFFSTKKGELKTTKETIGDIIQEYGKAASLISGAKETAEFIGKSLANYNIETLRGRVETKLNSSKKSIVIFIDDIDRLEKDEIHAIFRLVKLTGDFPYLTYVLSFDENMVASAIGERFGEGNKEAGINFLEKIIQIPLKLPLAQRSSLKTYCFQMVDQAISNSKIEITDEEARSFANKFISFFLLRLNTPRLAVRYGNTLTFTLPLLKDEVNTIDLLLIEAIHIFYPEIYELIRNQPDYFIGKYQTITQNIWNNDKIERYNQLFDQHCRVYKPEEKESIKGILNELFPMLKQGLEKKQNYNIVSEESLYNSKSISSSYYFNRYFSYTVIKGDISDIAYNELIDTIKNQEYAISIKSTQELIAKGTPENFIQKIKFKVKTFDSQTAIKMSKILGELGNQFPNTDSNFLQYSSPYFQAVYCVSQLVKDQIAEVDQIEIIKWLIEYAQPFSYAIEIFDVTLDKKDEFMVGITKEDLTMLSRLLINRAKSLSNNKPIWIEFPVESKFLLGIWANNLSKEDLHNDIKKWIDSDISLIKSLVSVFAPLTRSNIHPMPYNGDLNYNQYVWLKTILPIDYILQKVTQITNYKPNDSIKYVELESQQTDENMLNQLIYWYNQDKNNPNNSEDNIKIEWRQT